MRSALQRPRPVPRRVRRIAFICVADRFHFMLGDELQRCALKHPGWTIRIGQISPEHIPAFQLDALVVYFQDDSQLSAYCALGLPLIALYRRPPGFRGPCLIQDNDAIARLAADYFESRGLRQFGFVKYPKWVNLKNTRLNTQSSSFSEIQRQAAFLAAARRKGIPCSVSPDYAHFSEVWRRPLDQWLQTLPKPVGLLCASDSVAGPILESCYMQNLAVPEQISVLGIDNDERGCALFHPALSSIDVSLNRIAEQVCRWLEMVFDVGRLPSATLRIGPASVVERHSTSPVMLHDPIVSEALRLLKQHAFEPVNIKALFSRLSHTRRQFDRRFQTLVGRTPHEELNRLRVERAMTLLRETRHPLADIAALCGFSSTTHMRRVFMTASGAPPQDFRRLREQVGAPQGRPVRRGAGQRKGAIAAGGAFAARVRVCN